MRKIFAKKPSKDLLVLMTGTFIAQLIPFLIAPILTRLYEPEDFGTFGLYFSISMIISVFITGRYEMAIMLPKTHKEAANLVGLSFLITIIISLLIFILVLLFKHPFAVIFKTPDIENWLFVLPFTMFAIGTYQALNYWNNRKEKYARLAYSRVARSVGTSAWSIGFGLALVKKGGLILGDFIGQLFSVLFLFFRTRKEDSIYAKEISKAEMLQQAKRYSQFPKFNVASGLFEKLSGQLPVLFLAHWFGDAITGFFSFSQRIISAPSAIIARAFGDIFRQKATVEFQLNGNCTKLFGKTAIQLFILSIIPFIIFYFLAPDIFAFIFGAKWRIAGEYAQIMTPMFFLQFVVSPVSSMFLVAEKQKIDLYIQFVLVIGVIGSFLYGYNVYKDPEKCLIFFTFVYCIKYIIELYLSYQFSKGKRIA
jgi:O-antigen/teichoic acid export membrane protein